MKKQTATYRIHVKGHKLTIKGELVKSELAQYGNRTGVVLTINRDGEEWEEFIDTRYSPMAVKNLAKWLKQEIMELWPVSENEVELIG